MKAAGVMKEAGAGMNDADARQGLPRIVGYHPKLGRGKEGSDPEFQRKHGPTRPLF